MRSRLDRRNVLVSTQAGGMGDPVLAPAAVQDMELFKRLLLTLTDRGVRIRNLPPNGEPDSFNTPAAEERFGLHELGGCRAPLSFESRPIDWI